jgi:hypothetical protein
LLGGCRRHLQIVDASPIGKTDGDDENEPRRLDQGAEHVHPHRFANAAEHDASEHE